MAVAIPTAQVPGVYHRRVGDIVVTVLHDGYQDVSMATVRNIPPEDAAGLLRDAFRPVPRRTGVNTFLVQSGGRTALVDTGCGPGGKATVGHLFANLKAAGISAGDIDTVLLTHMHPDHWGGLLDASGQPAFPNAELKVHEAEYAYWHDDTAMNRLPEPERRKLFFLDARDKLVPYGDRLSLYTQGEVFPGVTTVAFPGHTPGHTGMLVSSGADSLLIWGDIVHVPEIQVPRPEATMAVDVDPERGIETRRRAFDMVATDRLAFAGMHLHFPAVAHMQKRGDGYALIPDAWSMDF
ncbi:MBL fold metallo-hydrolase [Acidisphaera sp. L21]|uniref:MBL fold metallo-hydrolase n=1 Tax=Acidisphaera sp. L21 TaxID=1641851 RepID=UPI00131B865C|nr:MBL fold metallo-hydrolase [Acidisphaera sp. L21]